LPRAEISGDATLKHQNPLILITKDLFQTEIAVFEEGRLVEFYQEPNHQEGLVGNVYVGRISRILPGMESAFVDVGLERDGFLFEGDIGSAGFLEGDTYAKGARRNPSIKRLREGDRVLVQVSKEPMGPKGARLSSQLSLPGNYLVFMPYLNHIGVSRKVSGDERKRLREMVRRIRGDFKCGFILRTAAEHGEEGEFAAEMQALAEKWELIRCKAGLVEAPALVHQEADAVERSIREILLRSDGSVKTDDPEIAARCEDVMKSIGQDPGRVALWKDRKIRLFERYGIPGEVEKALRPKVWLPSGGCIVIQPTEALVSIDVNSGRYTGKRNLEETAFKINMEAAREVIRQLRLRSLGGIIVIDFIDMTDRKHREALLAELQKHLESDRAKSRILSISEFGLVEMTRKRSHKHLLRVMTGVCPCCEGRGRVAAPWRVAQNIVTSLQGFRGNGALRVKAAPEVIRYLEDNRDRFGLADDLRLEHWSYPQTTKYDIQSYK